MAAVEVAAAVSSPLDQNCIIEASANCQLLVLSVHVMEFDAQSAEDDSGPQEENEQETLPTTRSDPPLTVPLPDTQPQVTQQPPSTQHELIRSGLVYHRTGIVVNCDNSVSINSLAFIIIFDF